MNFHALMWARISMILFVQHTTSCVLCSMYLNLCIMAVEGFYKRVNIDKQ